MALGQREHASASNTVLLGLFSCAEAKILFSLEQWNSPWKAERQEGALEVNSGALCVWREGGKGMDGFPTQSVTIHIC